MLTQSRTNAVRHRSGAVGHAAVWFRGRPTSAARKPGVSVSFCTKQTTKFFRSLVGTVCGCWNGSRIFKSYLRPRLLLCFKKAIRTRHYFPSGHQDSFHETTARSRTRVSHFEHRHREYSSYRAVWDVTVCYIYDSAPILNKLVQPIAAMRAFFMLITACNVLVYFFSFYFALSFPFYFLPFTFSFLFFISFLSIYIITLLSLPFFIPLLLFPSGYRLCFASIC